MTESEILELAKQPPDMQLMKVCGQCGALKNVSEFYKDKSRKDGLGYGCKACDKAKGAKSYLKNKDAIRAKHKAHWAKYSVENEAKLREKNKRERECADKAQTAKKRGEYLQKYEPKRIAKNAVRSMILTGRMIAQPCEICGEVKADAHHDDYAKPIDVRWLCRRHHKQWHAENGQGKNGETQP